MVKLCSHTFLGYFFLGVAYTLVFFCKSHFPVWLGYGYQFFAVWEIGVYPFSDEPALQLPVLLFFRGGKQISLAGGYI